MENVRFVVKTAFRTIGFLIKTFINLIFRIFYFKEDKLNPLPPPKSNLLLLPANVLAKKIRQKEITSTEIIELYIERIKEVQPYLNCYVAECFDEALREAIKVDHILSSKTVPEQYNEKNAPLLGVPFTCKETQWVKGMPNTAGLVRRKMIHASEDSNCVRYMREAGAILLCLTNISELCFWMESRNNLYGLTKNPYNLSRSVGGSSGGEAAIMASAASIIGIGSDIGGSIRIPCCLNGVYGHKGSNGLVSLEKKHPPSMGEIKPKLNAIGPICRYASDLRLLLKIQSEPAEFAKIAGKFEKEIDLKKLNYYVITDIYTSTATPLSTGASEALYKAVNLLEKNLNVRVKHLDLEDFSISFKAWSAMMRNGAKTSTASAKLIMDSSTEPYNPLNELLKVIFRKSDLTLYSVINSIFERIPVKDPEGLMRKAFELKRQVEEMLGEDSVILSPGYPTAAPYHHQQLLSLFDCAYFTIYNVLGLPCTQIPIGLDNGLPVGIQIVAKDKCDHLTIRLAEYFEEHLGGWKAPF